METGVDGGGVGERGEVGGEFVVSGLGFFCGFGEEEGEGEGEGGDRCARC